MLFEGRFTTLRRCVEAAIHDNIDLTGVNLRGGMLRHACLDGARMRGACLWGAQLEKVQMSGGDFTGADFRTAYLKEACIAQSSCEGCDFRGAYFTGAIVRDSYFDAAEFSCPSIFTVPWEEAAGLHGAVYWHRGEVACALSKVPLVISGLPRRIVMMENHVLIGNELRAVDSQNRMRT